MIPTITKDAIPSPAHSNAVECALRTHPATADGTCGRAHASVDQTGLVASFLSVAVVEGGVPIILWVSAAGMM